MRRIRKGPEPEELRAFRAAIRPRGHIPDWSTFQDPARGAVRSKMASDQEELCCYCSGTISNGAFHTEHFRPRDPNGGFPERTYTWRNLLASCEGYPRPGSSIPIVATQRHCGAAKQNWFDPRRTLDPQAATVESWFRFSMLGKIHPSKGLNADRYAEVDEFITKLNLNAPSLVERRFAILTQAAKDVNALPRADWRARYLDVQPGGLRQEFLPALHDNYQRIWSQAFPA